MFILGLKLLALKLLLVVVKVKNKVYIKNIAATI